MATNRKCFTAHQVITIEIDIYGERNLGARHRSGGVEGEGYLPAPYSDRLQLYCSLIPRTGFGGWV